MIELRHLAASDKIITDDGDFVRTPFNSTLRIVAEFYSALARGDTVTACAWACWPGVTEAPVNPDGVIAAYIAALGTDDGGSNKGPQDLGPILAMLSARYGHHDWTEVPYSLFLAYADQLNVLELQDRIVSWESSHAGVEDYRRWVAQLYQERDGTALDPDELYSRVNATPMGNEVFLPPPTQPHDLPPHLVYLQAHPEVFNLN